MIEAFLFLFTGIIGVVTLILMISSYRSNPFYNAFLFTIIVIISIRFLIHGSYELQIQNVLKPDKGVISILYLVIIPCFYLYHKNLAFESRTYNLKDLKHLIFIGFLYFINTNVTIQNSFLFHYGMVTNFVLICLFITYYIISIFKILSKKIWFKKDLPINSKHFNLVKNWTIYLFTINTLGAIALLTSIYTEINSGQSVSGKSMAIVLLLFWLFIYFKILTSPEILYGLPILNKKLVKFSAVKIEKNKIEVPIQNNWILETNSQMGTQDLKLHNKIQSNINSYINEIDALSSKSYVFRDPKVSISDISNKLNVPASHIVYLFKCHSNSSFSEYRMHSRIQDSLTLIEDDYLKTNTLESLAYKVGFSSYNPFFIAFKKMTSLSPLDYIRTIKKQPTS